MTQIQKADVILHNATILTMNSEFTRYDKGAIAVKDGIIVAVGEEKDILAAYDAPQKKDCLKKVLMPGFVNTHCHVPMTLLRGLSDDLRLDVWLLGYIMPVEREFVSPNFVKLGTKLACAELIKSGVTTFADMYYFEDEIAEATAECGLRGVLGQTVMKYPVPDANSYEDGLLLARKFIQKWKGHPIIVPGVAPHAPYTCTDEILQSCAALAIEFDVPLQIHLAESTHEVETNVNTTGKRVISYVADNNILKAKTIAAHCVHIDSAEMHLMTQNNSGIAHNPSSNLKLASGIAPISKMLEMGINVGIGTDGTASNNDLDMYEEIRLAAMLAKGSSGDPTAVPAKTALHMATQMGAKALHVDHLVGSLEVGKRADIQIINLKTLHNSPSFARDPNGIYAQIVYAAKSTDVQDVMVNGKWLMVNSALTTINEQELLNEAQFLAQEIDAFLIPREKSVLAKLVAIGGAMEGESFEVQLKAKIESPKKVTQALKHPDIKISRKKIYREFDTYFAFANKTDGFLRYREDETLDENKKVSGVRYRLTLVNASSEQNYAGGVILSQSRYLAEAFHSLRFYREYFNPTSEFVIEKERERWLIEYKGTEFFINVDTMKQPQTGTFVELKSRTWSKTDAEKKAAISTELLKILGADLKNVVHDDYVTMYLASK